MASLLLYIPIGLLLFVPGSAASTNVKEMLEAFLSHPDLKVPPDIGTLGDRLDILRSAPAAEVRQILPLAHSLLRSPNPNLNTVGYVTLIAIAARPDSAELLAPDIPEIITWLDNPDRAVRGSALGILEMLHPTPPPTLVPYLLPRLLDSQAPTDRLLAVSRVLILAAPDDPAVIAAILNLPQEHPGPEVKVQVLGLLGAPHQPNDAIVAFLASGLVDPDPDVRLQAVQAVENQHPELIRRFQPQLRKIAADPHEQSPTRESASRALERITH